MNQFNSINKAIEWSHVVASKYIQRNLLCQIVTEMKNKKTKKQKKIEKKKKNVTQHAL